MSDYSGRIARLQERMRTEGANLTLLAGTDQMRYLTGWREGGHERFVGLFVPAEGEPAFVVPKMNAPQARQTPAGITQVLGWEDHTGWQGDVEPLLAQWGIGADSTILVDDELLSVHLLHLQSLCPGTTFRPAGDIMASLRQIKTEAELAAMQRAADLIDSIYEEALSSLREGITELEFHDLILAAIKQQGSRPSFAPLICFGANAALPHHHTGSTALKQGDIVIIDIGCISDNYASDITRTVSFGEPSDPDAKTVYRTVSEAHLTARAFARPGVSGEATDAAARKVIRDAGYGDYFVHRTGHGIGLSTHEPPYIVQGNAQPLQAGMCFSVEPGIYLPGRFGVRIENIVTVTADGVRSLDADAPTELKIVPTA
jgi:Xaa-Pro aminopeptidase